MNNKVPKISVVMSVYNGEEYLREAIDSILNQTFRGFEFVIVDDGSTDKSTEIIKSYHDDRIIFIQQENRGLAEALNEGVKIAKGVYVARMDADDVAAEYRLEKQVMFLERHPEYVLVGSYADVITEDGKRIYERTVPSEDIVIKEIIKTENPFIHSTVMFRRDVAINCGLYEEVEIIEDIVFWRKMSERGLCANLQEPLCRYRITPFAYWNIGLKSKVIKKIIVRSGRVGYVSDSDRLCLAKLRKEHKEIPLKNKKSFYYLKIGKAYIERENIYSKARLYLFYAIRHNYFNWNAWFNLMLTFLPRPVLRRWKSLRIRKSIQ